MQASAKLFASVNGTDDRKLEWSKAEYAYKTSETAMVPIMSASNKNLWGANPYFKVKCSTQGYENIKFSAKISGTKKGPANYKLQYSTDNTNYTDVITAAAITQNKNLQENLFDGVSIPAASDKSTVYFKITAVNTKTIEGGDFKDSKSGEAAINDIIISGTSKSAAIPTLAAPTSSVENNSEIYGNTEISLSCGTSKSALIQYTVNDGAVTEYTGKFMPFKNISDSKITIKA